MVRLTRGGADVPLKAENVNGNRVTLRPRGLPEPNSTYQLSVQGVENPATFRFATGEYFTDPAVTWIGRYTSLDGPIEIRFSSPMDVTSLMASQNWLIWMDQRGGSGYPRSLQAAVTWSADATLVQIRPAQPLTIGETYKINPDPLFSAGGTRLVLDWSFRADESIDRSPVTVSLLPADGSQDVPLAVQLRVSFSRAVIAPRVRLYENDLWVPAGTDLPPGQPSPRAAGIFLQWPLKPETNYRIEVDAFEDDHGNAIPPTVSSFRTGTAPRAPALMILSTSPAQGEAGVSLTAPAEFRFNNPIVGFSRTYLPVSSSRYVPFRTVGSAEGNTLRYRPDPEWPAAATISATVSRPGSLWQVIDWAGQGLQRDYQLTFRTAALNDPVAPVLEEVTPPPGTLIPGAKAQITLRFSKPVNVSSGGIAIFYGSNKVEINGTFSQDFRSVTYALYPPANSRVSIVGTDAIHDNAGNSLAPFVVEFPTGEALPTIAPTARLVETAATNITVRFDRIMNIQSVLPAIRVTEDGQNVTGSLEVLENGQSYRFRPDSAFRPGAVVRVFILATAVSADGFPYTPSVIPLTFYMPGTSAQSSLQVTARSFAEGAPSDDVLEVAFSGDLDASSIDDTTVWLRRGPQLVPGKASLRDGRILRFTPQFFLEHGAEYVLTAGSGLRGANGETFPGRDLSFRATEPGAPAEIESVTETEVDGRPALRVRFRRPVSPLAPTAGPDGTVETRTSTDPRERIVIPGAAGAGEPEIEVQGRRLRVPVEAKPR